MKTDIDTTIGIRLAALMFANGISREAMAQALECSPMKVRRYETAHSQLSAAQIVTAAKALGVTASVITGEESFRKFMAEAGQEKASGL